MTSPSRRKRPTTVPAPITPAPTRANRGLTLLSLTALTLGLTSTARSQEPVLSSYRPRPVVTSSAPSPARWVASPATPTVTQGTVATPPLAPALAPAPRPAMPMPPLPLARSVTPVRYQVNTDPDDARSDYQIQLEPPGLERISRLDSDEQLQERIRQETRVREPYETVLFPEEPILSRDTYAGRGSLWTRRTMFVEPNYTCYRRLYFQDLNAERYGWDLGPIHPVVSTAKFFYDLALWPMHFANDPCGRDCNTGYCLPGDPVPFLLYPPEISVNGTIAEIAVIVALVAIFP